MPRARAWDRFADGRVEDHGRPKSVTSDLTNFIGSVIKECPEDGMIMPFIVCAVSPNGSVVVSRVGSGDMEPLAEHHGDRGFSITMTIVVVDQENKTG